MKAELRKIINRQLNTMIMDLPLYHDPHCKHPGMNNRPVEAAVLRHQSHPIITNLSMIIDLDSLKCSIE
jgi:hypothetical protein